MITFAERCILCGGPVMVTPGMGWGPDRGRCVGYCGQKQEPLENMTLAQMERWKKIIDRQIAIANAKDVEVKGDRL